MSEVRFWEKDFVLLVYKQAVYWSLSDAAPLGMGRTQDFVQRVADPEHRCRKGLRLPS